MRSACLLLLTFAVCALADPPSSLQLNTGKQIYQAACLACHGHDGKGQPESVIGFKKPDSYPDFSRCDQTTAEYDYAYKSVIRDGGPAKGFSQIMPSFGLALNSHQIDLVVEYLRGFCKQPGWPRAELNLPRALITEKAYPEDEEVITSAINLNGTAGVTNEIVHEQRFGKLNQLEVSVPVDFTQQNRIWYGGFGDIGIGLKRVLWFSRNSILSAEGLVNAPTGPTTHGLGSGTFSFETFAAYDQILPANLFLQEQFGSLLPKDTTKEPQSIYWRNDFGQSFRQRGGLGRMWTPMIELVANRDLVDRAKLAWDVVPQFQVTLSKRQHVIADLGFDVPVTETTGRSTQLMFYVLWDWQDGKITEGW